MLSLFRNKIKQKNIREDISQDKNAKIIVDKFLRLQQQWATFMQQHIERLSIKSKVIVLVFFCLGGAGFSFLLIAKSFMGNNKTSFRVARIQNAEHIGKSGEEKILATSIVTKQEHEKIQSFRQYMDSLSRSPLGKRTYDSILITRPGLMDSVIVIENIYQSQIKK